MIRFNGNIPGERKYNRPLFWMALLTTAATFPLIFMGGLVTSHQAGMSVPDWPNSWGYNMFTFPPSQWVSGIFYEHTHRLVASGVGFMALVLTAIAWLTDKRAWVRWTSIGIALAVMAQGALGGLRVILSMLDLAIVHGIAAQLFFCFIATYCLMTSPLWRRTAQISAAQRKSVTMSRNLAALATTVVAGQLVIGAIMRHNGAGLAIPDFPAAYGHLLPPTHLDAGFHQRAIDRFGTDLGLNDVTLFQIWIHFTHRIGAVLVTIVISTLAIQILFRNRAQRPLVVLASTLIVLLALQITLGILTVLWRKPADIASMHVAVGALVLMTTWLTFIQAVGMLRPGVETSREHGFPMTADEELPRGLRNRMAIR